MLKMFLTKLLGKNDNKNGSTGCKTSGNEQLKKLNRLLTRLIGYLREFKHTARQTAVKKAINVHKSKGLFTTTFQRNRWIT